jgi:hypothetical protein
LAYSGFFLTVQDRKGLEVSFQRWVNKRWVNSYMKAQKIKENYKQATNFYRKHPKQDCKQAIETLDPAGGLQRQGGATLIPAVDETTWLGGGLHCRSDDVEDPHAEENARAKLGAEHGEATHLTLDCGSMTLPMQRRRRREPKPPELSNLASARSKRP